MPSGMGVPELLICICVIASIPWFIASLHPFCSPTPKPLLQTGNALKNIFSDKFFRNFPVLPPPAEWRERKAEGKPAFLIGE